MAKRHCPKHRQLAFVSKENEETTKCQRAKIQGANSRPKTKPSLKNGCVPMPEIQAASFSHTF
jgi:hypothetical protein